MYWLGQPLVDQMDTHLHAYSLGLNAQSITNMTGERRTEVHNVWSYSNIYLGMDSDVWKSELSIFVYA
jgi:hypothetical protein